MLLLLEGIFFLLNYLIGYLFYPEHDNKGANHVLHFPSYVFPFSLSYLFYVIINSFFIQARTYII